MITKSADKNQVDLVKKFPLPTDPNNVFDAPAPNDAPIPAPLPCCTRINTTRRIATIKSNTINIA